uniref:Uncharacterized protein n=1 Tax=Rhizophora mucronata TaxID=61149 RepID=A0A2P2N9W6_RHIMU
MRSSMTRHPTFSNNNDRIRENFYSNFKDSQIGK